MNTCTSEERLEVTARRRTVVRGSAAPKAREEWFHTGRACRDYCAAAKTEFQDTHQESSPVLAFLLSTCQPWASNGGSAHSVVSAVRFPILSGIVPVTTPAELSSNADNFFKFNTPSMPFITSALLFMRLESSCDNVTNGVRPSS